MSSLNGDFSITEVPAKRSKHLAQQNGSASVEDDDARRFDDLFSELVNDLSGYGDKPSEIVDALRWFKEVNEYNVPHGKKNRGLTVVHSYRYLIGSRCSEESLKLAMVLGWCIEWLQAYFLVSDDIMDSSVTRRGQPCWYKQPKVGLVAINDALYLESAVYFLLKKYFRHLPYYADLVDLFHEVGLQTVIGQNLDLITAPASHVDFASFSLERYNAIVKYKTAFYSFYLPVASALYMAGIDDVHSHSNARTILLKMGEFFQIQIGVSRFFMLSTPGCDDISQQYTYYKVPQKDDFLDCYGNPEITGKIGTDIEDNKCSWLIVQALNRASEEQKASLLANYARHDSECVRKVKQIFSELKLPELYAEYEEQSYTSLIDLITSLSGNLPHDMFIAYANKIYKRQK